MSVNDYAVASDWYLGETVLSQEPETELIPGYPEYEDLEKTWSAVPDGTHWAWEAGFEEIKALEEGGLESAVEVRYAFTLISSISKQECTNIFLGETPDDDFIVSPNPGEARGLGQAELVYTACNKTSNTAEDVRRRNVRFVFMSHVGPTLGNSV
ncbi:hypothetical protein Trihar35433_11249 [Trichoderma harzianum]|nr:hypothetical protein Trihar35433_11249 [Trichoderma harzianum]